MPGSQRDVGPLSESGLLARSQVSRAQLADFAASAERRSAFPLSASFFFKQWAGLISAVPADCSMAVPVRNARGVATAAPSFSTRSRHFALGVSPEWALGLIVDVTRYICGAK